MDVKKMNTCPECGSDNILYSDMTNSIVCKDCGVIFADSPVFEPENDAKSSLKVKASKQKKNNSKPAKSKAKKK